MAQSNSRKGRVRYGRLLFVILVMAAFVGAFLFFGFRTIRVIRNGGDIREIVRGSSTQNTRDNTQKIYEMQSAPAGTTCNVQGFSDAELKSLFYFRPLDTGQREEIDGSTFSSLQNFIKLDDLVLLRVLYLNFDGETCVGELVVNQALAPELASLFYDLYLHQYPIFQMTLPDLYEGSEETNGAANNSYAMLFDMDSPWLPTSANTGYAVVLNPLYNPKVTELGMNMDVTPEGGYPYANRAIAKNYMISKDDYAYQLFTRYGYSWGGDNPATQNYGLFSKPTPYKLEPEKPAASDKSDSSENDSKKDSITETDQENQTTQEEATRSDSELVDESGQSSGENPNSSSIS